MFALADCNNFYASCERVFRPDLQGKPIIVLSNNDGCAVARSNEAKALGIKMGDPFFKIRDIIERHNVAVFSGNMSLYGDMSQRVRWVLEEFAPTVEVYSIDEAFLDLRGMDNIDFDAYAKQISQRCWKMTSIPVSVGIAPTKTLAKIASKLCKQYPKLQGGCYMHRKQDIEKVLRKFPIEDVWGIGRKSARKLYDYNIRTAFDFTQMHESIVRGLLGITGLRTWHELRGTSCIEIEDSLEKRHTICVSRSFDKEINKLEELTEQIANFAASATEKLRAQHSVCCQMVVFATTNRFKENGQYSNSSILVSFSEATNNHRATIAAAVNASRELYKSNFNYKKAGVIFSKLLPANVITQSLFENGCSVARESNLSTAMDSINHTFGRGTIKLGAQGNGKIKSASANQSPHYTTLWSDIPKVSVK